MSEYIDRQAAYDAIRKAFSMTGEECDGCPETSTGCDELDTATYEDGYNDGYYDGYHKGYNEGWKEGQEALEMWERERERFDQ